MVNDMIIIGGAMADEGGCMVIKSDGNYAGGELGATITTDEDGRESTDDSTVATYVYLYRYNGRNLQATIML